MPSKHGGTFSGIAMSTTLSRVTARYQATIPREVRQALGIRAGDRVAYEIERGVVRLRRATPLGLACAQAVSKTLTEWDSRADDAAYADL